MQKISENGLVFIWIRTTKCPPCYQWSVLRVWYITGLVKAEIHGPWHLHVEALLKGSGLYWGPESQSKWWCSLSRLLLGFVAKTELYFTSIWHLLFTLTPCFAFNRPSIRVALDIQYLVVFNLAYYSGFRNCYNKNLLLLFSWYR